MEFHMTDWYGVTFGQAIKALAKVVEPMRPALIHGDRVVDWGDLDRLTDAIGAGFLAKGLRPGDVVGHQLRNSPEYLLSFLACAKAGLTPVNVNYHYRDAELADIMTRFNMRAIVQNAEFAPVLAEAGARGASVDLVFSVDGDESFAELTRADATGFKVTEDPDVEFYLATGGTTGSPKAVVWRQMDAWAAYNVRNWTVSLALPPEVATSLEDHARRAAAAPPPSMETLSPLLMLSPLMHGTGLFSALICLFRGGTVVTLPATRFDADQAIDTISKRGVLSLCFVGDAFGRPLADALEARADGAERIASLRYVVSSGAVLSPEAKARILKINNQLVIVDALGSSESAGTAISVSHAKDLGQGAFSPVAGSNIKILDEQMQPLSVGSEAYGVLARSGPLPMGYLGEDALNARTFPTIDGVRYVITGDRARLTADGRIEFAGRDGLCINTGGEKVFAEEVEAVLQTHAAVKDVRVVGVPDARFGKRIAAVVQTDAGPALEAKLNTLVRATLAAYKAPRLYVFTDRELRLNNGKGDYKTALKLAEAAAAATVS
jgi:fatty-acyl-CoA synthase